MILVGSAPPPRRVPRPPRQGRQTVNGATTLTHGRRSQARDRQHGAGPLSLTGELSRPRRRTARCFASKSACDAVAHSSCSSPPATARASHSRARSGVEQRALADRVAVSCDWCRARRADAPEDTVSAWPSPRRRGPSGHRDPRAGVAVDTGRLGPVQPARTCVGRKTKPATGAARNSTVPRPQRP